MFDKRKWAREYYRKHNTHLQRIQNETAKWEKSMLFNILGGAKCILCGYSDLRALCFDHINGGGCEERRKFKNVRIMRRHYLNHPEEAKKKLQVLCANCNMVKRDENGEHWKRG